MLFRLDLKCHRSLHIEDEKCTRAVLEHDSNLHSVRRTMQIARSSRECTRQEFIVFLSWSQGVGLRNGSNTVSTTCTTESQAGMSGVITVVSVPMPSMTTVSVVTDTVFVKIRTVFV